MYPAQDGGLPAAEEDLQTRFQRQGDRPGGKSGPRQRAAAGLSLDRNYRAGTKPGQPVRQGPGPSLKGHRGSPQHSRNGQAGPISVLPRQQGSLQCSQGEFVDADHPGEGVGPHGLEQRGAAHHQPGLGATQKLVARKAHRVCLPGSCPQQAVGGGAA